MIVSRTVSHWVCIAVPDGLEAGEEFGKDPHPIVCGEPLPGRIDCHQLRSHDSAGFVCAPYINVDGRDVETCTTAAPKRGWPVTSDPLVYTHCSGQNMGVHGCGVGVVDGADEGVEAPPSGRRAWEDMYPLCL